MAWDQLDPLWHKPIFIVVPGKNPHGSKWTQTDSALRSVLVWLVRCVHSCAILAKTYSNEVKSTTEGLTSTIVNLKSTIVSWPLHEKWLFIQWAFGLRHRGGCPINKRKSVKTQNPGFGDFASFLKSFRPWDPFFLSIHITIIGIPWC